MPYLFACPNLYHYHVGTNFFIGLWQKVLTKLESTLECFGGLVVNMINDHFNNLSSNSAKVYSFFYKMLFEKNENKQQLGRDWSVKKVLLWLYNKQSEFWNKNSYLDGVHDSDWTFDVDWFWKVNFKLGSRLAKVFSHDSHTAISKNI